MDSARTQGAADSNLIATRAHTNSFKLNSEPTRVASAFGRPQAAVLSAPAGTQVSSHRDWVANLAAERRNSAQAIAADGLSRR
jgi:hypothetical protein